MIFNSLFFVFGFLPVFLLLYYLLPGRLKDVVLIAGSLVFYAWGEPVYVILLIFSAFLNYYMARQIDCGPENDRKGNLIFAVVLNLLILCFFKYYPPLFKMIDYVTESGISHTKLALPVGISFYTFRNLSYIVDVYKGKSESQKSFFSFCVYSLMFPHMSAGPIVRYEDVEESLKNRKLSLAKIGVGGEAFIKGLAKKVILADSLALIYSSVCSAEKTTVISAWIGIFAYTMQIYFDFSGYSDMAIGIAKMLGFDFRRNFDYPYISENVSEFWRRWHISLGSWFRDYVYIPLGGNRVSTLCHVRNIMIVWALTGIWHGTGANFLVWGLYYGLLLLLEKFFLSDILKNLPQPVRRAYTFICVMIGWVFFSLGTLGNALKYLGTMFGIGASGFADAGSFYYLRTGLLLFIISILAARPYLQKQFRRQMKNRPVLAVAIDVCLFAVSVSFMVFNSYSPFLYQQF